MWQVKNKIPKKSASLQKTGPNHYGQVTAESCANRLLVPPSQSCCPCGHRCRGARITHRDYVKGQHLPPPHPHPPPRKEGVTPGGPSKSLLGQSLVNDPLAKGANKLLAPVERLLGDKQGQLQGVETVPSRRALHLEGLALGLMPCCHCLHILNFWTRIPTFSLVLSPANYVAGLVHSTMLSIQHTAIKTDQHAQGTPSKYITLEANPTKQTWHLRKDINLHILFLSPTLDWKFQRLKRLFTLRTGPGLLADETHTPPTPPPPPDSPSCTLLRWDVFLDSHSSLKHVHLATPWTNERLQQKFS